MGINNSKTKCYILDDFNKKHNLIQKKYKIYQEEVFMFFYLNKPLLIKDGQLFIYQDGKVKKYIVNQDFKIEKDNLSLLKIGDKEYYEFTINLQESRKISFRLNKEYKLECLVFKFNSRDLHKIS
jgi:hypothetical protein